MTQEEKELILKDLCARLPYNFVYCYCNAPIAEGKSIVLTPVVISNLMNATDDLVIKPYLRPMSSMTEEEKADLEAYSKQELDKYANAVLNGSDEDTIRYSQVSLFYKDIDWYNKHHIDYRGLIQMGLALEATEGMYNNKIE